MRKRQHTTFKKLTTGFIFFGMLPLVVVGLTFLIHFSSDIKAISLSNYTQITSYFARNVEDVMESVDTVMAELYDYEKDEGTLSEVIKNDAMDESARNLYMAQMLRELISKSEYISSERFVDCEGRVYSLFYDQNKTLKNNADFYTKLMDGDTQEATRYSLMILSTTEESQFCVNTDDYIFCLVRNFYDISSVEKIAQTALGTFYVDINVNEIEHIVDKMNLDRGQLYIYNKDMGTYIYSANTEDYLNGADPLMDYRTGMTEEKGNFQQAGKWVFYEQIGTTDQYAVLVLDRQDVFGGMFENAVGVILVLCFVAFVLMALYMFFSRSISQPVAELKRAMEEVQQGNLSVQAQVNTKDEMQYISEGFNKMVQDLQDYIEQVYVAQICQKEAELNALKMQIQPHYLYNTLDVIRMTALENDDEDTAKLLESLASQLRYVLGKQNERMPLKDEFQMLQDYFVIIKARYQNRITFHASLGESDANLLIPKMLLQPIVENAVRHGLKMKKGPGTVVVEVKRHADWLEIGVMDNGVGIAPERVARMQEILDSPQPGMREQEGWISVGTKNVYDRIKLNCGKEYGFTIQSVEGMGTVVTFRLPIWEEDMSDEESNTGR
ncbi:MAG: sensor histidine kinase [Eubacterium sp.]|nr:sensor histidine kinase [Eubacterium sp.]